ncbi:thiamine phosphate synthase [Petroclostridium sp. X23]|nr:thiamine phosphate synthase [Petroclostridium sp. X23]WHH60692.1 thiamine phosphate synthase [Petroclostridium sp. X23]
MDKIYRIIDANINRVSEGLRVLEDLARFYYEESLVTEEIKKMRHRVRKTVSSLSSELLGQRDAANDLGFDISQKNNMDNKTNIKELIAGNFKRVQEGLRVIEENLKIAGKYEFSKVYEMCRYDSYTIEKMYYAKFNTTIKKNVLNTDLYCLTAEEYSGGRNNIEVVSEMIAAGVEVIQYREKDKKALYKYEECKKIRELTKQAGVTFIVNDDIDIALLVKADGIHIGQEDLPIEKVRELVGEEMIIGLSTHSPMQAQDAIERGADYIGVGPIFKTFTKKDVCDPVGLEYLEYAVKSVNIPFVAIGGIKEHNVAEVAKRGAKCIAMVTEIVGAKDIRQKIEDVREVIKCS